MCVVTAGCAVLEKRSWRLRKLRGMAAEKVVRGKNIDKDRCAQCGAVIVLVDGPVSRLGKSWLAGDWIHQAPPADPHDAAPGRNLSP
jgi:hypothetical protein